MAYFSNGQPRLVKRSLASDPETNDKVTTISQFVPAAGKYPEVQVNKLRTDHPRRHHHGGRYLFHRRGGHVAMGFPGKHVNFYITNEDYANTSAYIAGAVLLGSLVLLGVGCVIWQYCKQKMRLNRQSSNSSRNNHVSIAGVLSGSSRQRRGSLDGGEMVFPSSTLVTSLDPLRSTCVADRGRQPVCPIPSPSRPPSWEEEDATVGENNSPAQSTSFSVKCVTPASNGSDCKDNGEDIHQPRHYVGTSAPMPIDNSIAIVKTAHVDDSLSNASNDSLQFQDDSYHDQILRCDIADDEVEVDKLSALTDKDDISDYLAELAILTISPAAGGGGVGEIGEEKDSLLHSPSDGYQSNTSVESQEELFTRLQSVKAQPQFSPYHLAWSTPHLVELSDRPKSSASRTLKLDGPSFSFPPSVTVPLNHRERTLSTSAASEKTVLSLPALHMGRSSKKLNGSSSSLRDSSTAKIHAAADKVSSHRASAKIEDGSSLSLTDVSSMRSSQVADTAANYSSERSASKKDKSINSDKSHNRRFSRQKPVHQRTPYPGRKVNAFNPLTHAATGTVNSTGGCMPKEVNEPTMSREVLARKMDFATTPASILSKRTKCRSSATPIPIPSRSLSLSLPHIASPSVNNKTITFSRHTDMAELTAVVPETPAFSLNDKTMTISSYPGTDSSSSVPKISAASVRDKFITVSSFFSSSFPEGPVKSVKNKTITISRHGEDFSAADKRKGDGRPKTTQYIAATHSGKETISSHPGKAFSVRLPKTSAGSVKSKIVTVSSYCLSSFPGSPVTSVNNKTVTISRHTEEFSAADREKGDGGPQTTRHMADTLSDEGTPATRPSVEDVRSHTRRTNTVAVSVISPKKISSGQEDRPRADALMHTGCLPGSAMRTSVPLVLPNSVIDKHTTFVCVEGNRSSDSQFGSSDGHLGTLEAKPNTHEVVKTADDRKIERKDDRLFEEGLSLSPCTPLPPSSLSLYCNAMTSSEGFSDVFSSVEKTFDTKKNTNSLSFSHSAIDTVNSAGGRVNEGVNKSYTKTKNREPGVSSESSADESSTAGRPRPRRSLSDSLNIISPTPYRPSRRTSTSAMNSTSATRPGPHVFYCTPKTTSTGRLVGHNITRSAGSAAIRKSKTLTALRGSSAMHDSLRELVLSRCSLRDSSVTGSSLGKLSGVEDSLDWDSFPFRGASESLLWEDEHTTEENEEEKRVPHAETKERAHAHPDTLTF